MKKKLLLIICLVSISLTAENKYIGTWEYKGEQIKIGSNYTLHLNKDNTFKFSRSTEIKQPRYKFPVTGTYKIEKDFLLTLTTKQKFSSSFRFWKILDGKLVNIILEYLVLEK